ncbi:MAG: hypothetical protein ACPLPQ_02550 [Candidatus Saccharicenans sp.]
MKIKKITRLLVLTLMLWPLLAEKTAAQSRPQPGNPEVSELVEKICRHLASYPDFEKWQADVVSSYISADKNWQPERIRRVKKHLVVEGETREEKILEAVEIEGGRTKNITEEYRQARLERLKKLKEEAEKARKSGQKPAAKNQLTKEDLVPFSEKKKALYDFRLVGEDVCQGTKVYVLEARARQKQENLFEGIYYISQETLDPLKMVLHPSRFPTFVREFQVEIELEPWQGLLMLKKSRLRVYGGFLFKTVRMVIEEDYSNFRLLG